MLKPSTVASVSSFDQHPRRVQELAGRAIADAIYRDSFGEGVQIARFDEGDARHILDRELAIDCQLIFADGMMLTLQEKFLSNKFASFKSITIEYEQNQFTHELGDWHKIASQLYFVGYLSPVGNEFDSWIMVDWCRLVIATQRGNVNWRFNANKDGHARASFKWLSFDEVPYNCVITRKG